MNYQGQEFYVLKFPTENKTFVYPEGGQWFELSSSDYDVWAAAGRYRGNSYAYCYGKHLVADEDGNILELDEDTYTDIGDAIVRVRDLAPLHSGMFGTPGRSITLTYLKLVMETGIGGVATNPQVMISISCDGGRTWGTEMRGDIGVQGEYLIPVEFAGINEQGEVIMIRLSCSGAYHYSFHSAAVDVEIGM